VTFGGTEWTKGWKEVICLLIEGRIGTPNGGRGKVAAGNRCDKEMGELSDASCVNTSE